MKQFSAVPKYPVGTKYRPAGKDYIATVIDYLVTRNLAGEIVETRYVAIHQFCGQVVDDRHVPEISIARGLLTEPIPITQVKEQAI